MTLHPESSPIKILPTHMEHLWLLNIRKTIRVSDISLSNLRDTYSAKTGTPSAPSIVFFLRGRRKAQIDVGSCAEVQNKNTRLTYFLCISLNEGHSRLLTVDECSIVAPSTENDKRLIYRPRVKKKKAKADIKPTSTSCY